MSTAILRFDVGASVGTDGESRSDAAAGDSITVASIGSGTTHALKFWDVTAGAAVPTLTPGAGNTWTFPIPAGVGTVTYGLELTVDAGLATEVKVRRFVAVKSANLGLRKLLYSEDGDPTGALDNNGAAVIAKSVDNEGANWRGWVTRYNDMIDGIDALTNALDLKPSVRAGTVAALPANTRTSFGVLTADANGALAAQDGVSMAATDRLLVKDEAAGDKNGIYVVTQLGDGSNPWILTRAEDADQDGEITDGMMVPIGQGDTLAGQIWMVTTNDPIVVDTTAIAFEQFAAGGGGGGGLAFEVDASGTLHENLLHYGRPRSGPECWGDALGLIDQWTTYNGNCSATGEDHKDRLPMSIKKDQSTGTPQSQKPDDGFGHTFMPWNTDESITIAYLFKHTTFPASWNSLGSVYGGSGNRAWYQSNGTDGAFSFTKLQADGVGGSDTSISSGALTLNDWHLAIVKCKPGPTGGSIELSIDGGAFVSGTAPSEAWNNSDAAITVGNYGENLAPYNQHFIGRISRNWMWRGIDMTDAQAADLWNSEAVAALKGIEA